MLAVGARLHRPNVERKCLAQLDVNIICTDLETRQHVLMECESVSEVFGYVTEILKGMLKRNLVAQDIIHLAFSHRCKYKTAVAVWFAVKALYRIFHFRSKNKDQLLKEMVKEIEWNLKLNVKIGSRGEMINLKDIINIVMQS